MNINVSKRVRLSRNVLLSVAKKVRGGAVNLNYDTASFTYQDGLVTRGESPLVFPIAFLVGAVFKVTAFFEVSTAE